MIELGCVDSGVSAAACDAYLQQVETTTRVRVKDLVEGSDKIAFTSYVPGAPQAMSVAAVQQGLKSIGFFPGGRVDGICGYRTVSAIRLFQEYVRTIERQPVVPDGRFGPISQQHLTRWLADRATAAWAPAIERWRAGTLGDTEYTRWLSFLNRVKAHYTTAPSRVVRLVEAFAGASDTRAVRAWDFAPQSIHLVGIRRDETSGKFDDIFVLLLKGLVFKFQGSTEPGATKDPRGLPFLVQGQHDYHFGWHQKKYLALRPERHGVLVVRSKRDKRFDDGDLDNGLEPNASINVHWGGKGMRFDVNAWSEGCQVINGSGYLNHENALVDCSSFAATNNGEVTANRAKTRGAYNVLLDLVTALGSDLPSHTVKYTLLTEQDPGLDTGVSKALADAREAASRLLP